MSMNTGVNAVKDMAQKIEELERIADCFRNARRLALAAESAQEEAMNLLFNYSIGKQEVL
jgi:predicted adenine nucleotide alpha hydrolase (AANH) superfamily ATPase